jgi:hypothetical protein
MYKYIFAIGLIILAGCGRHKPEPSASLSYNGFTITDVSLTPEHPNRLTPIKVQWATAGEAKTEDSLSIEVEWSVNGQALKEIGNVPELNPTNFYRDDQVEANLLLKSRGNLVNSVPSGKLKIENAPPVIMQAFPQYVDSAKPWLGYKMFVYTEDKDDDPIQLKYSWQVEGKEVGSEPTLPGSAVAKGQPITVVIIPNDGIVDGQPYTLQAGQNQNNNPPAITSEPPSDFSSGQFVYQVTASDPDGDSLRYALKSAPEGMTIDAGGCIRWIPGGQVKDKASVSIEVTDGNGGSVGQQFNLGTK